MKNLIMKIGTGFTLGRIYEHVKFKHGTNTTITLNFKKVLTTFLVGFGLGRIYEHISCRFEQGRKGLLNLKIVITKSK